MALFSLNKIAEDVRIALDRNMTSDTLVGLGDIDTLAFNDIVNSKVVEAVKRVHSVAPIHLLGGGDTFADNIYWQAGPKEGNYWGIILLPEDFMRFIVFEMSDWERPVHELLPTSDPKYKLQSSRYAGLRGTPQKPLCFLDFRPTGNLLEFYSCKAPTASVMRANYVPYPRLDEGFINIYDNCYDAVIYTIAELVLLAYGDTQKSTIMSELCKSVLI